MKNFLGNGNSIQLTAPVNGVVGGVVYKQGAVIGIVVASAAEGEQFTLSITGIYGDLPKATGEAWAIGDTLYLNADGTAFTKTAAGNTFAGYAASAQISTDTTGAVLLSH